MKSGSVPALHEERMMKVDRERLVLIERLLCARHFIHIISLNSHNGSVMEVV